MRIFAKRYHPPGTVPGTLSAREDLAEDNFTIRLIDYDAQQYREMSDATPADCQRSLSRETRTWVDVQGSISPNSLRALGDTFGLHDLAMEDVLNTGQRSKLEVHTDHLFLVMNLPQADDDELRVDQISLFLGKDFLITFCDTSSDPFAPVRNRLETGTGRSRSLGCDYLMYTLLDIIIDQGFPLLEDIGERIEGLEAEVLSRPDRTTLNAIHIMKRELLLLRRVLWPQREVINALLRDDASLIAHETKVFLRDCYDHTVQIMELVETFREMIAGILDVYLSNISYRMNDIMRVLTVIATIFIPLTFLVGVYGMNFRNPNSPWSMPELSWYYGYPLLWIVMIALVAFMLWIFKRNKWF